MMEQKYGENFGNTFKLDKIPETLDEFKEDCLRRIEFVMRDAQIKKVRRFCNKEQYRDEKIAALTSKHQLTGNQEMYGQLLITSVLATKYLVRTCPNFRESLMRLVSKNMVETECILHHQLTMTL